MRGAKVIPIASAKEDPLRLEQAFTAIAEELCEGELVCIFPEGRITKDGKLNVFKPGILKIIGQTPVPIVPMGLNGLWGSLFSRKDSGLSKRPRKLWSTIELNIGKAIAPESANIDKLYATVEELVENF
jgi:1-acyl-sn-glycerol-3-phosphate acyltransferase